MRLKEAFTECDFQGRTPVLPFFPFPLREPQAALDFLVTVFEEIPWSAAGLAYPGVSLAAPGGEAALPGGTDDVEWNIFQFIYALKHRTGVPVVLALRYADILRFGIIPYGQEGHKVGLDALLARDPLPEELDYFTAEMAGHGVALAAWLHPSMDAAAARSLCGYASAFAYLEGGIHEETREASAGGRLRRFQRAEEEPAVRSEPGVEGWILTEPLGPKGWAGDADPSAVAAQIRAWSLKPPRQ
jgi:hypothetical protein